jgi:methyltransferase, FkbM family
VTVYRGALSDHCGEGAFVAGHSASTGHLGSEEQGVGGQSTVRMLTLDAIVGELKIRRLQLVKIDVEGAESAVLRGAAKTLINLRPWLIVELHTPEQDVKVAELLIAHDYELKRISGPPIKKLTVGWPDRDGVWGTIMARPN